MSSALPPPSAIPDAAVAPLDYQLEPKPVSRRRYRRVVWLCGAGWLALAVVVLSYGTWRVRMAARAAVPAPVVTATVATATVTPPPRPRPAPAVVVDNRQERRDRIKDLMAGASREAGTVVYEEDPAAAGKLLASRSQYVVANLTRGGMNSPQGYQPPAYVQSPEIESQGRLRWNSNNAPAELFRGPLTSPAGNSRLVRILLKMRFGERTNPVNAPEPRPQQVFSLIRQLQFEIFRTDPNDSVTRVRSGDSLKVAQPKGQDIAIRWVDGVLRADRAAEHNVRFYAGQLDPKDRSHFTIDYELNGARNVIDGWLTDDDFLRIRPRGGKVNGGDWLIAEKP
jgi:hypothetical protein